MGEERRVATGDQNEDSNDVPLLPPPHLDHLRHHLGLQRGREGLARLLCRPTHQLHLEIEKAFEDCSHLSSTDEIMVCINDILAATNCQACLFDVLPFLC